MNEFLEDEFYEEMFDPEPDYMVRFRKNNALVRKVKPEDDRVYVEDVKVGDLVTVYNTENPNGVNAMIWEGPIPHKQWEDGTPDSMDGMPRFRLLWWNEDMTDVRIDGHSWSATWFATDLGMVRGKRSDHYVLRRGGEA